MELDSNLNKKRQERIPISPERDLGDRSVPYSKLEMTSRIKNADIASDAAIGYSKLNLVGLVDNDDIADAAGISTSKTEIATYVAPATWSVTWTASTPPSLGNGTMARSHTQIGRIVTAHLYLTMGSTTTYGSGEWSMDLPVNAEVGGGINYVGSIYMLDSGTAHFVGTCRITATDTIKFYAGDNPSPGSSVRSTIPFTWATGDILIWSITYIAD